MTDPSERSGSRWEPSEPDQPVQPVQPELPAAQEQVEPDRPVDPIVPPPPAWQLASASGKRRPARVAIAAGALGVLAAGGVGGFVIGHAVAGEGDGDGSTFVDRDGAVQEDRGFPGGEGLQGTPPDFDGDGPGAPPDVDGDGFPSLPDQGQGTPDSGTSNSSIRTGSAT
jgi:hypothetical protein